MKVLYRGLMALLFALHGVWAGFFMYACSFMAPDGRRYFCLFDDPMICMRFAANLAHGHGLVYNVGEHVEGYTNLLYVLIMTVCHLLVPGRSGPVLAMSLIGLLLVWAVAWAAIRLAYYAYRPESIHYRYISAIILLLFVLTYYPLNFNSILGMETGLLVLLLAGAILLNLDYRRGMSLRTDWFTAGLIALTYLTRPDSVPLAAAVGCYVVWLNRFRDRQSWVRLAVILAGSFLAVLTLQHGFRWVYYHDLVPNTARLKVFGNPFSARVTNGLLYMIPFWRESKVVLVSFAVLALARRKPFDLFALAFLLINVALQVSLGGDVWQFWRILVPAMIFVFVSLISNVIWLSQESKKYLVRLLEKSAFRTNKLIPSLALVPALFFLLSIPDRLNVRFQEEITFHRPPSPTWFNERLVVDTVYARYLLKPGSTIGSTGIGQVGYYALDFRIIDFLGKCDPVVARMAPRFSHTASLGNMLWVPGHNKYDLNYSIRQLRPTFLVDAHWAEDDQEKWVNQHYEKISAAGYDFWVLKGSDQVNWNKVRYLQQNYPVWKSVRQLGWSRRLPWYMLADPHIEASRKREPWPDLPDLPDSPTHKI